MKEELKVNKAKKKTPLSAYIWVLVGLIYAISPLDIIPDFPGVGWIDDIFVLLTAILNLFQQRTEGDNQATSNILKYFKWGAIILGVIVVLLILLLGATVVNIFTR